MKINAFNGGGSFNAKNAQSLTTPSSTLRDSVSLGDRDQFGNESTRWSRVKNSAGRVVYDYPVTVLLGSLAVATAVAVAAVLLNPGVGHGLSSFIDPANPASPLSPANPVNMMRL